MAQIKFTPSTASCGLSMVGTSAARREIEWVFQTKDREPLKQIDALLRERLGAKIQPHPRFLELAGFADGDSDTRDKFRLRYIASGNNLLEDVVAEMADILQKGAYLDAREASLIATKIYDRAYNAPHR